MGAAANIAVMGAVHAIKEQPPFMKDRLDDRDIGQVATAEIRVVQDEQVAF